MLFRSCYKGVRQSHYNCASIFMRWLLMGEALSRMIGQELMYDLQV